MRLLVAMTLALLSFSANAAPVSFDISWFGPNNYSMTGSFSFDDSLLGIGTIDETDVVSMSLEAFENGVSLGSTSISPRNLNFDTITETFIVTDLSLGPMGQSWNTDGSGIGFASGRRAELLYVDGEFIPDSRLDKPLSGLTATRSVVPIPAAIWFFASALTGLGLMRRKSIAL